MYLIPPHLCTFLSSWPAPQRFSCIIYPNGRILLFRELDKVHLRPVLPLSPLMCLWHAVHWNIGKMRGQWVLCISPSNTHVGGIRDHVTLKRGEYGTCLIRILHPSISSNRIVWGRGELKIVYFPLIYIFRILFLLFSTVAQFVQAGVTFPTLPCWILNKNKDKRKKRRGNPLEFPLNLLKENICLNCSFFLMINVSQFILLETSSDKSLSSVSSQS